MIDYKPIRDKIEHWVWYQDNKPQTPYSRNYHEHDEFRKNHDLDCILTNGNLYSDTIFSLWIPLRFSLVKLNGYDKLKRYGKVSKNTMFLRNLLMDNNLENLLPADSSIVTNLSYLFAIGQTRCNVMILPERWLQVRGEKPYFDYVPYFLYECFDKGAFNNAFKSNDSLIEWIRAEQLQYFFANEEIKKSNILDLSGSGDVKVGVPKDLDVLLSNYISILNKRSKSY